MQQHIRVMQIWMQQYAQAVRGRHHLLRILVHVCLLTSDSPCSSKYSLMKGILRLVVSVSTCMVSPGNCLAKPVPSVANASQELQ